MNGVSRTEEPKFHLRNTTSYENSEVPGTVMWTWFAYFLPFVIRLGLSFFFPKAA